MLRAILFVVSLSFFRFLHLIIQIDIDLFLLLGMLHSDD